MPDTTTHDGDTTAVARTDRTRIEDLVHLLDSSMRIPGTERRFGWDAVLGVVPGIGDASGLVLSGAVIVQAIGLGARGWTLAHMLVRALFDALVGTVPVLGTVFDFAYKANERNLRLLDRHLADPEAARVSSRSTVLLSGAVVVGIVTTTVALLVGGTTWLLARLL